MLALQIIFLLIAIYILKFFKMFILLLLSAFWSIRCEKNQKKIGLTNVDGRSVSPHQQKKLKRCVSAFFEGISRYTMLKTGTIPSFLIRNRLYRFVFRMKISKKTVIYSGCEFRNPCNIHIGDSVIGPKNIIDGRLGVTIGNNVCTGTGVKIWTMQHNPQDELFNTNGGAVVVGDYVWLASFSTILPNKNISEGAVVASGAIITKDCDAYLIYAGIPGKKIDTRRNHLNYKLNNAHWWFV